MSKRLTMDEARQIALDAVRQAERERLEIAQREANRFIEEINMTRHAVLLDAVVSLKKAHRLLVHPQHWVGCKECNVIRDLVERLYIKE